MRNIIVAASPHHLECPGHYELTESSPLSAVERVLVVEEGHVLPGELLHQTFEKHRKLIPGSAYTQSALLTLFLKRNQLLSQQGQAREQRGYIFFC